MVRRMIEDADLQHQPRRRQTHRIGGGWPEHFFRRQVDKYFLDDVHRFVERLPRGTQGQVVLFQILIGGLGPFHWDRYCPAACWRSRAPGNA